jgi:hypothetical protein
MRFPLHQRRANNGTLPDAEASKPSELFPSKTQRPFSLSREKSCA